MKNFLVFLVSFCLSFLITPLVRSLAIKNKFVAYPRPDRWHKKPTALLGGIGIYLSCVFATLFLGLAGKPVLPLFIGSSFLFLIGLLDDSFHFTPYVKLFTQIIAGCVAVFFGVVIGLPFNFILAIPLTLLWIIGITNSFNLLDNIDGLAAGIAAICALMLFFSSLYVSENILGVYGLVISGAALGFLPYNFNPAKIFMGDSGSMFLGYSLAVISISGSNQAPHLSNFLVTLIVPVLILTIPIFDTVFVMLVRQMQGRSIFEGGKDHTSHRLVTLGLSPRKTVLLLYFISAVFGLISFLFFKSNPVITSAVAFLAVVVLLFLGIFLYDITTNNNHLAGGQANKRPNNNQRTVLNSILLHKRRFVEVFLDFIFIFIAYYSAYFLRFEGGLLANNLHLLRESITWIILIKMSVFFMFGLYRGVWKYIGISDFITIFKVVSLGSVISILFLTFSFRFQDYSRAVFFIDWLMLLFLVLGSRFLIRIIDEFFSRLQAGQKNIFIFGAGDAGEMVLREIKRNRALQYNPVGFIDDNPAKVGNKIHGVPILGSRDMIKELAKDYEIKEAIIAIPSIDTKNFSEIIQIFKDCNITYRNIKGILD